MAHEHTRDMKKDFHQENKSVEIKSSKSDNRFSLLYKGAFIKDKKLKQATELRKKIQKKKMGRNIFLFFKFMTFLSLNNALNRKSQFPQNGLQLYSEVFSAFH